MKEENQAINIDCSYDDLINTSKLKPHPKNNNIHPKEQIDRLAKIISYQGFRSAIVVSSLSGFIVKGHGRLIVAKKLGMKKVPVNYQAYENESQEYADLTADNEIARWAELDLDSILNNAHLLSGIDLDVLGIKDLDIPSLDELIPESKNHHENVKKNEESGQEDIIPEVDEKEIITKRGDVWSIGNHNLMCGDSTNDNDVEILTNGNKLDITLTSPPYNVSKQGFQSAKYNSGFESKTDDEYLQFLIEFTNICIVKSNYLFINNQFLANNRKVLIEYQYKFRDMMKDILIWNKKIAPPNICKGAFNTKWEYVFCISKDSKTRGFPCSWQGKYFNVIETESNSSNEFASIHKAGFPIAFPSWILEKMDFCKSVYDPFCGTGTTLIAAEKLNIKCYGMEIDPMYCDVIIKRWQDYTGETALCINNPEKIIE